MMYEYWTPRGECRREIASSREEREVIDNNLWVKSEQNIHLDMQLLPSTRGNFLHAQCHVIVYINGGPLKGGGS